MISRRLNSINSASIHRTLTVLCCGGTISSYKKIENGNHVIHSSDKNIPFHTSKGSKVIKCDPIDSSQATPPYFQALQHKIIDEHTSHKEKHFLIEFGTDTAADLLAFISPMVRQHRISIVIATSMSYNNAKASLHHAYNVCQKSKLGTIALSVDTKTYISSNALTPIKNGTYHHPFNLYPHDIAPQDLLPKDLCLLKHKGYSVICASPLKPSYEIATEITDTSKKGLGTILIGRGDYNFPCHPSILHAIHQLQGPTYLSTNFLGSFISPEKIPYQPRNILENTLRLTLLDQKKAKELLTAP